MFRLSLTQRYIPAIIILAIFIISSHILITDTINSNKELAKIINISGKQRMLSQRLIIVGQNYFNNQNSTTKTDLLKVLNEMKISHDYLLTKVFTNKLCDIYFKKDGLDDSLKKYLAHFDNLLKAQKPIYLKIARAESKNILFQLDSAVKEYERYSNDKLNTTSTYEFYIMIITLFILLLEVLFIFKPASNKIEQHTKELEENKEYEETVIESNNNAIIAIDWTGKITTYNKKAQDIFGWTKQEMIGSRDLLKIVPPQYKELHTNASKKYLATGKSCGVLGKTHELQGLHKDGTIFDIRISFGSKYKIKGAIVVANIADITKEKEQSNILVQQSKMASMGEMMQNIAHQWRQPLSSISTAASGIQAEKEYGVLTDKAMDDRLENILTNTQYLSQTIDDFSNFFKKSKNKEKFLLANILDKTQNIVNETFKNYNIKVYKNYDKYSTISYTGYENELSQVIINILNNAKDILIEKNIKTKIVKIDLTNTDKYISITICDNGGGVPDHILPKIFEPYFTTKDKTQGTGIGLYMSNDIIINHFKGSLTVNNKKFEIENTQYYGACFEVKLYHKVS
jgi:PAS domain S-box-containing protein